MAYPVEDLKHALYKAIPVLEAKTNSSPLFLENFLNKLPNIQDYTRENVRKQAIRLLEKFKSNLVIGKEGRSNSYIWASADCREMLLGANRETSDSQALAFHLIQQHFSGLMPPVFRHELRVGYDAILKKMESEDKKNSHFNEVKKWKRKLAINYLGVPLIPHKVDDSAYTVIFDALRDKKVVEANYKSIHSELNRNTSDDGSSHLIFSPQEIRLQNMQLSVMALVQNQTENPFLILLSLAQLTKVKLFEKFDYSYKSMKQLEFRIVFFADFSAMRVAPLTCGSFWGVA